MIFKFVEVDGMLRKLLKENGIWVYKNHYCSCGCKERIHYKKCHTRYGIPNFIHGHQTRGKNNPMCGVRLYGKSNSFFGKHHTEKTLKQMSKIHSSENSTLTENNTEKLIMKPTYGGMSSPIGITFFGENYRASLSTPLSIGWKGLKIKPAQVTIQKSIVKNEMKLFLGFLLMVDIVFNSKTFIVTQLTNLWEYTNTIIPISIPSEYVKPIVDFPWVILVLLFELCLLALIMYSMKRTRSYHGAEHKSISAAENNDLDNAPKYSKIHPKCGTNILPMYFVYVSLLSYLFFPMMLGGTSILLSLYTIRKVPPIGKLSVIIGSKLQLLTTKEPSELQLKHAMKSLQLLMDAEKNGIPNNAKEYTVMLG